MKPYFLLFVFAAITPHWSVAQSAGAREFQRQDSLLKVWINDLAKHSGLPIDTLRKMEQDSARKVLNAWDKEHLVLAESATASDDHKTGSSHRSSITVIGNTTASDSMIVPHDSTFFFLFT